MHQTGSLYFMAGSAHFMSSNRHSTRVSQSDATRPVSSGFRQTEAPSARPPQGAYSSTTITPASLLPVRSRVNGSVFVWLVVYLAGLTGLYYGVMNYQLPALQGRLVSEIHGALQAHEVRNPLVQMDGLNFRITGNIDDSSALQELRQGLREIRGIRGINNQITTTEPADARDTDVGGTAPTVTADTPLEPTSQAVTEPATGNAPGASSETLAGNIQNIPAGTEAAGSASVSATQAATAVVETVSVPAMPITDVPATATADADNGAIQNAPEEVVTTIVESTAMGPASVPDIPSVKKAAADNAPETITILGIDIDQQNSADRHRFLLDNPQPMTSAVTGPEQPLALLQRESAEAPPAVVTGVVTEAVEQRQTDSAFADGALAATPSDDSPADDEPNQKNNRFVATAADKQKAPDKLAIAMSVIDTSGIKFEISSSRLTHESLAILSRTADILKAFPSRGINIVGHTDASGSEQLNQAISEDRAAAVMKFLIEQGIEPLRLQAFGYGDSSPIADNGTAEGRARNRRIELRY